eukprot:351121-Chlamydomonas_euryale.AAC.9
MSNTLAVPAPVDAPVHLRLRIAEAGQAGGDERVAWRRVRRRRGERRGRRPRGRRRRTEQRHRRLTPNARRRNQRRAPPLRATRRRSLRARTGRKRGAAAFPMALRKKLRGPGGPRLRRQRSHRGGL